jgi:epidermal growth factor receptor kinase substrate 8
MSNNYHESKLVKRGDHTGMLFDVDHLVTFKNESPNSSDNNKQQRLRPEEGFRKLLQMRKTQGIWPLNCQMLLNKHYVVIYDKNSDEEIELFPLNLIFDVTSVPRKNYLIFSVLGENRNHSSSSKLNIFECKSISSRLLVDKIIQQKEEAGLVSRSTSCNNQLFMDSSLSSHANERSYRNQHSHLADSNNNSLNQTGNKSSLTENAFMSRIEKETKILNCCFDDIENFVARLQSSVDQNKQLDRSKSSRKVGSSPSSNKKIQSNAQFPSQEEYVDILSKFKYSFNLLASLKAHIRNPNSPELVDYLFTPLTFIINVTNHDEQIGSSYRGLANSVWQPLLSKEAKDLLINRLSSEQQTFWESLGDAWCITRHEAQQMASTHGQYRQLLNQVYRPKFYNGWSPLNEESDAVDSVQHDLSKMAIQQQKAASQNLQQQVLPIQKSSNNSVNQSYQKEEAHLRPPSVPSTTSSASVHPKPLNSTLLNGNSAGNPPPQPPHHHQYQSRPPVQHQSSLNNQSMVSQMYNPANDTVLSTKSSKPVNVASNIPNYEAMKKWAIDLMYRGVKVFEITHDRHAKNEKEISVKLGELLEVLDDKRNWWKLRNFKGEVGYAPVTILRPYEFGPSQSHNQSLHSMSVNQPEKVSQNTFYYKCFK